VTRPAPSWRLSVVESLPSTSEFCRARAAEGEPEGLAVLALRQTAGRGSRGRTWESPPGSLALSVLLRPETPAAEAGQWALRAGIAIAEGCSRFVPDDTALTLKWPNDLLLGGRKVGGILVDGQAAGKKLAWVVIGFGANLAEAPRLPDRPAVACLAEFGPSPSPQEVAAAILERLGHWCDAREQFASVRAAWLRRGPPLGSRTTLRLGTRHIAGRFAGLAEDGGLLLQTADGLHAYATGEVLLGDAAACRVVC
jgi:BirA family biotin operon repressor/biotin-[acetyl-CoA-carboxylase] ligase